MPGVHLGYDRDVGRLVVGGEVAIDFGEVEYDFAVGGPASFSLDRMVSVNAKVGFDVGRVLVYGTAGVTRAEVGDSTGLGGTPPGSAAGTHYGVGAAVMVTDRLVTGAEIPKKTFDPYEGASAFDSEATAVSLRLSYRF